MIIFLRIIKFTTTEMKKLNMNDPKDIKTFMINKDTKITKLYIKHDTKAIVYPTRKQNHKIYEEIYAENEDKNENTHREKKRFMKKIDNEMIETLVRSFIYLFIILIIIRAMTYIKQRMF